MTKESSEFKKFVPDTDSDLQFIRRVVLSANENNVWGEGLEIRKELLDLLRSYLAHQERYKAAPDNVWLEERGVFVGSQLHQMGLPIMTEPEVIAKIISDVESGVITDEMIRSMALAHKKEMQRCEQEIAPQVQAWKKEFKELIASEVEHGLLPRFVLERLRRIDEKEVTVADRLLAPASHTMAHTSRFSYAQVYSDVLEDRDLARHSLFHEFLHELSGKTVHIREKTSSDGSRTVVPMHEKEGVSLRAKDDTSRFEWLNEAITEYLALRISKYAEDEDGAYEGSKAYTKVRKVFQQALDAGLKLDTAIHAYFEDIESTQSPKMRGQAFAKLAKELGTSLKDPHALNRIENEFWFDQTLGRAIAREFVPQATFASQEEMLAKVPSGVGIYKISFTCGGNDLAAITRDYFKFIAASYYENGGSDEKAIERLGSNIERDLKRFRPRVRWAVTSLGRKKGEPQQ